MTQKVALITGVAGQDGSYLAELLLSKKYVVHGVVRQSSVNNTQRIAHIIDNPDFHLHCGDVTRSMFSLVTSVKPDEIYNLAAQTFVKASFEIPLYTMDANSNSVVELLEVIRSLNPTHKIKLYQASTSEMFGSSPPPQNEDTPFLPCSPYAISKLASYWFVKTYRSAYGIFAVNGILFNHESPRRGECFVTKKICRGVADIAYGYIKHIELGNLNAKRDWGHVRDYVECMWKMLQQESPEDFVVSTGISKTVREFVEEAFKQIDMRLTWEGDGLKELGVDQNDVIRVTINPELFRPSEVEALEGDSAKARKMLNWTPTHTFENIVSEMVNIELMCNEND
jgi:GDPmannose 4,6-dehydratase